MFDILKISDNFENFQFFFNLENVGTYTKTYKISKILKNF